MSEETKPKTKILIVDDDKFLIDMYSIKFNESGYEVGNAQSGPDALNKLDGGYRPDIFLVDVVMPMMDGFELVQNIVQKLGTERGTIIILSNLGQKEDVEKGLALGADGYIVKASATPSEVVEKVKEITANKKK